jgi:glucosamine--fructose-6-phosphate aminotransferase (isomerizing)
LRNQSWHSGLVGKYLFEEMVRTPVQVDIGSEFRYRDPLVGKNDLFITISQSGETADTLAAAREAKQEGCARRFHRKRGRQHAGAGVGRRALYPLRAGDRRRFDQGLYRHSSRRSIMLSLAPGAVCATSMTVADGKSWLDQAGARCPRLVEACARPGSGRWSGDCETLPQESETSCSSGAGLTIRLRWKAR